MSHNEYMRGYYAAKPEFRASQISRSRARRLANLEAAREYDRRRHFQRKYGLTLDNLEDMLAEQGGLCGVCCKPMDPYARFNSADAICVDHDHATNTVRSLVHRRCNSALGLLMDDPLLMHSAGEYVEAHKDSN